jgi:RluA family pseudouridine synthase
MNKNKNKFKKVNNEKPAVKKDYKNIRQITVEKESELLTFLLETFKDQSRNSVKSLLSSHRISVNGAPTSQFNFKLVKGDVLIITKEPIKRKIRSNLPIIFENNEIIVINKPSGLLSVPSDKEKGSTAYRMVSDYVQQKDKHNRIYITHRLDEDTSGVLMFSKNPRICELFQDKWNDIVKKRGYYAIVEGVMEEKKATITSRLVKNAQNLMYSTKKKNEGQLAITHYEVIKENEEYSLLDVNIDTGRKNQIRVHLGEKGHHVIGDDKYGEPSNPLKRLGLHAYELTFIHPLSGKKMTFTAPMPKEFETLFTNPPIKAENKKRKNK